VKSIFCASVYTNKKKLQFSTVVLEYWYGGKPSIPVHYELNEMATGS
jgi:hypothetical protein